MEIKYQQLFGINVRPEYYTDEKPHNDLSIQPTSQCNKLLMRYKMLARQTFNGITLYYQCDPLQNGFVALKPVSTEEKFTFILKAINTNFWYYADVQDWTSGTVFLLKNLNYNTTGDITVLNGALINAMMFSPMQFKYAVPIENVTGLIEIRNNGALIKTLIVRAKTNAEPLTATESYLIDLTGYDDGEYLIRHINTGGNNDKKIYCSGDYSVDALAIIEITYKNGAAYTGVEPFQNYLVNVSNRKTDWFYDVHIRDKAVPIALASQLSIAPAGMFSRVSFNDAERFVQFKSVSKIAYSQTPLQLQLKKTGTTTPIMDPMPLPSATVVQKDSMNNLFTKVIVNV